MKILYEAGHLLSTKTGVGVYTQELLEHLLKIDKKNKYELFGFYFITKTFVSPIKKLPKNARWRLVRLMPGKIYTSLARIGIRIPIELLTIGKPDVAIFTNYVRRPTISGAATITVVYDLSFTRFQQLAYKKVFDYYRAELPTAIAKSSHIVTISEHIKKELQEDYPLKPEQISVVYPGVDTKRFKKKSPKQILAVRKKLNLDEKYLLFTGTVEVRKNITTIIRAYKKLPQAVRDEYQLVLAGGQGYHDEELTRALKDASQRKLNLVRTGYIDAEDQAALYSGASLYLFPSHYEGFGMPPLEAMACGVPVIASNAASLPEVVGKAALLVDPTEPSQLTRSIQKVLSDDQLRNHLVAAGHERITHFTWEASAAKLYDIIGAVYEKNNN